MLFWGLLYTEIAEKLENEHKIKFLSVYFNISPKKIILKKVKNNKYEIGIKTKREDIFEEDEPLYLKELQEEEDRKLKKRVYEKYEVSSLILTILEIEEESFKLTDWKSIKLPRLSDSDISDFFNKIKMEVFNFIANEEDRKIFIDHRQKVLLDGRKYVENINDLVLKYLNFNFDVINIFQEFKDDIEIMIDLKSSIDRKIRII